MPFTLTNTPTIFKHMGNDIIRDLLDIFLIIYFHDPLIYSKTQEHDSHVRQVLKWLLEYDLYAKLEKSSFDWKQVQLFGYIIFPKGIFIDPTEVHIMLNWHSTIYVRCAVFSRHCNFLSQSHTRLLKAYFASHKFTKKINHLFGFFM